MLCPPGCCGHDGRAPNRFCKPKGPAAVTPPRTRGAGSCARMVPWFHLTSAPPEAGNLASVQDLLFFCLGCCGHVAPSVTQTARGVGQIVFAGFGLKKETA